MKHLNPSDYHIGLYDSATGKTLQAASVVELQGHDCRTLLLFTRAQRGDIVQILRPYKGEKIGMTSHYHLDELQPTHWWIESQARHSGVSSEKLWADIQAAKALERHTCSSQYIMRELPDPSCKACECAQ